jgi:hypothetical protein
MKSEIVSVVSDYRSGSTLLDQLLGAHPEVCSVGEVQHLAAYAREDRSLYDPQHPLRCSCGETVPDCRFWSNVEANLGRPLSQLNLQPRLFEWQPRKKAEERNLRNRIRRQLEKHPSLIDFYPVSSLLRMDKTGEDSFALFDAIAAETNACYIVDASKSMQRFQALRSAQPDRLWLILLCRDYRGVIYSKMKRGRSIEASAASWVNRVKDMDAMSKQIPADHVYRLRYEDLCVQPETEIRKLCAFLDIEFTNAMMSRPSEGIHHIGGSPSKFQSKQQQIKLDDEYRHAFNAHDLSTIREIVGPAAASWGYD